MPSLSPSELEYAKTAKLHLTNTIVVPASPGDCFEAFDELDRWLPKLDTVMWRAGGRTVGGRRFLAVAGMKVEQTVLAWEPGHRFAFTVTHCNLPLATRYMEDIRFTRCPAGTEISWNVHADPRTLMRVFSGAFSRFFNREAVALHKYLSTRVSAEPETLPETPRYLVAG